MVSKLIMMSESGRWRVPVIVVALLLLDIVLGAASLANYFIGQVIGDSTYFLNLDSEHSIATWYSSMKLFCICVMAVLFVYHFPRVTNSGYRLVLGLPILFLLLSMDEILQGHEWIGLKSDALLADGDRTQTFFRRTGIWMFLLGVPFLLGFLWWAGSIAKAFRNSPGSLLKLRLGMMLMLLGALGVETLSNYVADTHSFSYSGLVFFEETLEMLGATVMFWGIYDLARGNIVIRKS